METRIHTLPQKLSFSVPHIILPKYGIIDAIALTVKATVKNTSGASKDAAIADLLKAFTEISVKSDSQTTHYNLNAYDVAVMNAYEAQHAAKPVLAMAATTIANDASADITFTIILNKGDIFAANHQDVTLQMIAAQTAYVTGLTITAFECKVTVVELVKLSEADIKARYGTNMELYNEPKVTTLTKSSGQNSELTPFMELPTGCIVSELYFIVDNVPDTIGIVDVAGELSERMNVDWAVLREINAYNHNVNHDAPANTAMVDVGNQVEANGLGLAGWSYQLGDMMIAAKNSSSSVSCRCIRVEYMINKDNAAAFTAAALESAAGI